MQQNTDGGKHQKGNKCSTKSRIAVVALATGAISGAGATGAAAAALHNDGNNQNTSVDFSLANDSEPLASSSAQVLPVTDLQSNADMSDQLNKAVKASDARVAAAREAARHAEEAAKHPFIKPAQGTYTSGFGVRWGAAHNGIDIANSEGTPIVAVADGTVIDSGPASGFGQWIRIKHSDGTITVYGHMSTLNVSVGQQVKAGQKIAGMGSMGQSTGTHLHFEVHPGGGAPIDPASWLAERGIAL